MGSIVIMVGSYVSLSLNISKADHKFFLKFCHKYAFNYGQILYMNLKRLNFSFLVLVQNLCFFVVSLRNSQYLVILIINAVLWRGRFLGHFHFFSIFDLGCNWQGP